MSIQSLPTEVREAVRSTQNICSLSQAIEELVLNSIDAGANSIEVTVNPSSWFCSVSDNGRGISYPDLKKVGERYHTSKCRTLEELASVQSYGFRGEALCSIGNLSHLEILTRTSSGYSTLSKEIKGSQVLKCEIMELQTRVDVGTTMRVNDLFYNVPVRRKGITAKSELENTKSALQRLSLIHPQIAFSVFDGSSGQSILQTGKLKTTLGRFVEFFGQQKLEGLKELHAEEGGFSLSGWITQPFMGGHNTKSDRFTAAPVPLYVIDYCTHVVDVNGRHIKKSALHDAINKPFKDLQARIDKKESALDKMANAKRKREGQDSIPTVYKFPIFIIQLKCNHQEYDITYHPDKSIIEFAVCLVLKNWNLVLSCTKVFLRKLFHPALESELVVNPSAIGEPDQTPPKLMTPKQNASVNLLVTPSSTSLRPFPSGRFVSSEASPILYRKIVSQERKSVTELFQTWKNPCFKFVDNEITSTSSFNTLQVPQELSRESIPKMKVIGQVDHKFILTKLDKKLFILDQHAVHERIQVEKFQKQVFGRNNTERNVAATVVSEQHPISRTEKNSLVRFQNQTSSWGWKYTFSERTVFTQGRADLQDVVELIQVPSVHDVCLGLESLLDYVGDLEGISSDFTAPKGIHKVLNSKACRSAIKFGDELSIEACRDLIKLLADCKLPFQCAHGRPSIVPIYQLEE